MNLKQSLKKRVLMTFGTLGVAAAVAGGGTFATFNAQTTNAGNTFATGTLVMSNKVNSGSVCLSTAGGDTDTNANNCAAAFNLSVKKPGESGTANITLKNEGSLDAAALSLYSSACTDADASLENYHGTGGPCSKVEFYVQEYTSSTFATVSSCLYGATTVANTCDFTDTTKTLGAFAALYPNSGQVYGLGAMNAGTSRFIKVGVQLDSSANNSYQGRKASIDLTWFMSERQHQADSAPAGRNQG
jgi:predicted ribosomally synthesized peptide with SipW-like signal peptide